MNADANRKALAPWQAILVAIPVALLVIAVLESTHVPADLFRKSALNCIWMLALQVRACGERLWALAALQIGFAAVHRARLAFPKQHRLAAGAHSALAAGASFYCYRAMVGYERFAGFVPFMACFAVLGAALAWWSVSLGGPDSQPARPWLRRATALALLAGFVAAHIANYTLYYDEYPTLHLSALMVSYLLLQAGLSSLLVLFDHALPRAFFRIWLPAATLLLVAISIPLARSDVVIPAESSFMRYTILGQEISRTAWEEGDAKAPGTKAAAHIRDPRGVERFRAMSNLPELPGSFRLDELNILIISVEATRFDETSLHDAKKKTTPNLLSFAQNGAFWFTRAYAGSSYTVQSISSIFTMTYPSSTGLLLHDPRWDGYLSEDIPTAIDHLTDAGYDTFWASYSGAGGMDWLLGGYRPRFHEVAQFVEDADVLAAAKKALDRRRDGSAPFFGWVFFSSPHAPYVAHYDDMPGGTPLERYRQDVRYADSLIGELLGHLRETGLLDKTVVVIHGDHGEEFKEHGKSGHHSLYTECTNVPLVIRVPGVEGHRIDGTTSLVYLFPWLFLHGPTKLHAIASERLQHNIGPVLAATDGAVVAEIFGHYGTRSLLVYPDTALLFDFASKHYEMYDLGKDPGEKTNIFDEKSDLAGQLVRRFEGYRRIRDAQKNIGFSSGEEAQPETEEHRLRIEKSMARLSKAKEKELIAALRHEDWRVRQAAAKKAAERKMWGAPILAALVPALADPNRWVRRDARKALAEAGAPAVAPLLTALRSNSPYAKAAYTDEMTKKKVLLTSEAKRILEQVGRGAIPELVAALDETDGKLKRNLSGVLGALGPAARAAVPKLLQLTRDPDWTIRRNAVADVCKIAPDSPEVANAVRQAAANDDEKVSAVARRCLDRIEKPKTQGTTPSNP